GSPNEINLSWGRAPGGRGQHLLCIYVALTLWPQEFCEAFGELGLGVNSFEAPKLQIVIRIKNFQDLYDRMAKAAQQRRMHLQKEHGCMALDQVSRSLQDVEFKTLAIDFEQGDGQH